MAVERRRSAFHWAKFSKEERECEKRGGRRKKRGHALWKCASSVCLTVFCSEAAQLLLYFSSSSANLISFLRPNLCSKTHETSHKIQPGWKLTYFMSFSSSWDDFHLHVCNVLNTYKSTGSPTALIPLLSIHKMSEHCEKCSRSLVVQVYIFELLVLADWASSLEKHLSNRLSIKVNQWRFQPFLSQLLDCFLRELYIRVPPSSSFPFGLSFLCSCSGNLLVMVRERKKKSWFGLKYLFCCHNHGWRGSNFS